ncbi:hypothetical protein ADIARSV_3754 [Arcticibacter svalbardensis MN12-7]|uniref:Uncharacterized protein n=1 Tax=Arcticibacter svalbardensis MN12-7 TaxID=1150600 RepID=R9GNF9_9SPHI|nr:hypothetical protein [Arcticibacter svalbardensis]EOR93065.1 hypothetical protein ADIARSV_3754 [Arcticibacter svalbardensis MN12-7]
MKPESLTEIKKEIKSINPTELVEICFKLAKFKKENKEFLHYLLYESEYPLNYAEKVKSSLQPSLESLNKSNYLKMKELRKQLRIVTKHIRYTSSIEVEITLLTWFATMMVHYADVRSSNKALFALFTRQLEKIHKSFAKLHEDLQLDYSEPYIALLDQAEKFINGFHKERYTL